MKKIIEKTAWTIGDPELPESVKQKILEKRWGINVGYNWWEPSDYCFPPWAKNSKLLEFDLDRERVEYALSVDYRLLRAYLVKDKITNQIQITNESKRIQYPNSLKVIGSPCFFSFRICEETGRRDTKTGIKFPEFPSYSDSIIEPTEKEIRAIIYEGISYSDDKEDKLSKHEIDRLALHISKVADYVEREVNPLPALCENYEYLISEESIIETLQANEYYFDEKGNIV